MVQLFNFFQRIGTNGFLIMKFFKNQNQQSFEILNPNINLVNTIL